MSQTSTTLDFEATLTELEQVVSELEGEIKLERALELFDRGVKLSSDCDAFLKATEQKVAVLTKEITGSFATVPFEAEEAVNPK